MKAQLITLYLDWVNNWLSISNMADYYGMAEDELHQLINIGRNAHAIQLNKAI